MTDAIPKVGEYTIGENDNKAVVEDFCHEGSSAVGYIDQSNGKVWAMWDTHSGRCQWPQAGNRNFHIVGPYVPTRKRVEGWVNVYKSGHYSCYANEESAQYGAGPNCIAVVPIREIDPAAEKEARELLENVCDEAAASWIIDDVRRALSLLLPDEAA